MDDTVFHPGERMVQERTGERAIALLNARNISAHIPAAARNFVAQQRWCVVGAADAEGGVSASLLIGEPGFLQAAEDLASLRMALVDPHDRLRTIAPIGALEAGQSVAVLLIELQTRRRLRVNGHVASASGGLLDVTVGQAFPVCPRYIQKREPEIAEPATEPGTDTSPALLAGGSAFDDTVAQWVTTADTLFIASLGPGGAADVSHRGGRPGFVQVVGNVLRIPDYNGNSMFNTLGNLAMDARCGLVLPGGDGVRQLQLNGRAKACFDVLDGAESTGGTGRWIEFTVESWRVSPLNLPLRWRFIEASPFNP
ncbi:pyridoxamine 5'-phosphate oxidase family protein [Variovorax sp. RCC_210]|uniref:pyridoxamine 5'-phosphate oxidase family protein n=1 Tax=Variovorax sp. RCC_210 TaxID=3239217 RepID=UPI0035244D6A